MVNFNPLGFRFCVLLLFVGVSCDKEEQKEDVFLFSDSVDELRMIYYSYNYDATMNIFNLRTGLVEYREVNVIDYDIDISIQSCDSLSAFLMVWVNLPDSLNFQFVEREKFVIGGFKIDRLERKIYPIFGGTSDPVRIDNEKVSINHGFITRKQILFYEKVLNEKLLTKSPWLRRKLDQIHGKNVIKYMKCN